MPTAYVLGAGASRAINVNAPLGADLLPEALRLVQEPVAAPVAASVHRIVAFANDFYFDRPADAPLDAAEAPRLEDILTQLDLAIEEGRPLAGDYDLAALGALRNDLLYAISEVLRYRLNEAPADDGERAARQRGFDVLDAFVASLRPTDTVVSLNYDLILDNALFYRAPDAVKNPVSIDYGVRVRHVVQYPDGRTISPPPHPENPPVYKLHGSLNWVYCPTCQQLDVTGQDKGVRHVYERASELTCPVCTGRYQPLIVAPSLVKAYVNPLLGEVWRQAEARLAAADAIVFVGYSMPDADAQLRCLFTRAVHANRRRRAAAGGGRGGCAIVVVQREPEPNHVYERAVRLFGAVEYVGTGFAGYMERKGFAQA